MENQAEQRLANDILALKEHINRMEKEWREVNHRLIEKESSLKESQERVKQLEASLKKTVALVLAYKYSEKHTATINEIALMYEGDIIVEEAESLLSPEPQKAREYTSSIIKSTLDKITPEEQEANDEKMMASPQPNNPVGRELIQGQHNDIEVHSSKGFEHELTKQVKESLIDKKDNWISVKDRLPRDCQRVIFFDDVERESEIGYFVPSESKISDSITHWQPLPEPPNTRK